MDERIKKLILDVAKGNPGALTVIKVLMWYSKWEKMMRWCLKTGLVGDKLWIAYKDRFNQSDRDLVSYIEKQLQLDGFSVAQKPLKRNKNMEVATIGPL